MSYYLKIEKSMTVVFRDFKTALNSFNKCKCNCKLIESDKFLNEELIIEKYFGEENARIN